MFYEVRVYDGNGKLKKTISEEALHERHWRPESVVQDGKVIPHLVAENGSHKDRKRVYLHCKQCKKEFMKLSFNQIYCSQDCNEKAKYERLAKTRSSVSKEAKCVECGNVFISKRSNQKRCSDTCRRREHRRLCKISAARYNEKRKIEQAIRNAKSEANNEQSNG